MNCAPYLSTPAIPSMSPATVNTPLKLWVFTEQHLWDFVNQSLVAEHVRHTLYETIRQNNLTLVEFVTGVFNLGQLANYTCLTPANTSMYEYESVVQEFAVIKEAASLADARLIYGVDILDAIYQHEMHSNGFDQFTGYFYDDLFGLLKTVRPDDCADYVTDVANLVRYVFECIERTFVRIADTEQQAYYVSITSKDARLFLIVL